MNVQYASFLIVSSLTLFYRRRYSGCLADDSDCGLNIQWRECTFFALPV